MYSGDPSTLAARRSTRVAFVMEQALGHVTHAQNLRVAADAQSLVDATWLPIPFDVSGPSKLVPLLRSNWSVRASWRARRALDNLLARTPQDALVFHTQVTGLFSVELMRRIPSLVSLDATPVNYDSVGAAYNHSPAGDGWLDRQKYRMNRSVFHTAARLVSWSEWAKQSLVADYGVDPDKVHILAPGAGAEYFRIGERRPQQSTSAPGRVRLLFVGGDFQRKGGPLLLESLEDLLAESCELHIVTRDPLPARPNVHVHRGLGPNSPRLHQLFAEADAFVLPSEGECLALVLMEATAAGLPVITTNVGALPEAVVEGESGLVVPPRDGVRLRAALGAVVGDAQLRRRMGGAAHAVARQKFDAEFNNRVLLDVTREIAERGHETRRAA